VAMSRTDSSIFRNPAMVKARFSSACDWPASIRSMTPAVQVDFSSQLHKTFPVSEGGAVSGSSSIQQFKVSGLANACSWRVGDLDCWSRERGAIMWLPGNGNNTCACACR
jgi:hypothetical protein